MTMPFDPPDPGPPLTAVLGLDVNTAFDIVFAKAFQLCKGNIPDAEDLAQQVLSKIINKECNNQLPNVDNAGAYLRKVTRNAFIDNHKRRQDEAIFMASLEDARGAEVVAACIEPRPDKVLIDKETADLLKRGIQSLSPQNRETLNQIFYQSMSVDDIALRIGRSYSTVNARKHAALKQLRSFLRRHDWEV